MEISRENGLGRIHTRGVSSSNLLAGTKFLDRTGDPLDYWVAPFCVAHLEFKNGHQIPQNNYLPSAEVLGYFHSVRFEDERELLLRQAPSIAHWLCHMVAFHWPLLARHSTSVKGVTVRSRQLIFSSQPLPCLAFGVVLTLVLTADCAPLFAQGFSVANKSAPSVVGAGTFVSLEGKFTIGLPPGMHGFQPMAVNTGGGRILGDAYTWTMKEGSFIAAYFDLHQQLHTPAASERFFENIRRGMDTLARSQNAKLVAQRQIDFDGHPAFEVKIELPTGLMWQRYYFISNRLYEVNLSLETEQRIYEDLALKVLESFKVLSETDVSAALKEKAATAEPSPLPQEPRVPRVRSDAQDEGLHGKVKTVIRENEDLSGTWSVQGRKPSSTDYYNDIGNLTKREFYDYKGNLSEITVYGYLDGARVSRGKGIEREYNPPPMMIASPPGATRPKSDPRYSNKFTFHYDDQKRLIEKAWYLNNGELTTRYVYKYSASQREEFVYSSDGSLNQHYLSTLDAQGNEVEETSFETRDGSVRGKYKYAYEFDAKGNWIKRTTSKWVTKNGKSDYAPASVDYRTINYY